MLRTNIYLDEDQTEALDAIARAEGVSRAHVIRRILDQALSSGGYDLEDDLQAIDESHGVLSPEDLSTPREPDARARHLERIARR